MSFVFLFCSERSGSNFITSVMNGHPEISGPPPAHIFRLFGLNHQNYEPLGTSRNWENFLEDFTEAVQSKVGDWNSTITIDELRRECPGQSFAEAFDLLYSKERRPGEHISFVKENFTYQFIDFILTHWPASKFIYQVRDPRDVAASRLSTPHIPGGVSEAVDIWRKDQEETLAVIREKAISPSVLQVRYEDLITDIEAVSGEICRHIGVDFQPGMIEFYKDERTKRNAEKLPAWENLSKPVMANNAGKYRKVLTGDDIRYIELTCHELMSQFGYQCDTSLEQMTEDAVNTEIRTLRTSLSSKQIKKTLSPDEMERQEARKSIIEKVKSRVASI